MEGVGARLGRSSTRYGPVTVFTGPVRKWKKRWVHVSPSAAATNSRSHAANGTTNGNNGSRILLYKWAPIPQSAGANGNGNGSGDKISGEEDSAPDASEGPPRRRFKYVPIAVLEELKNEVAENIDDEDKSSDVNPTEGEPTSISNNYDAKPDINDVPMDDSQAVGGGAQVGRQDLNESTLDLSFNLNARDGDHDPDSKTDQTTGGQS